MGFEPTCPERDNRISSAARYDHFDNSPYNMAVQLLMIPQQRQKSKCFIFRLLTAVFSVAAIVDKTKIYYNNEIRKKQKGLRKL